jgi:uncharacterized protein
LSQKIAFISHKALKINFNIPCTLCGKSYFRYSLFLSLSISIQFMSYALITGASKGIGKCIAEELAKKGINLLLVARSELLLQHLCTELSHAHNIEARYLAIDLSKPIAPEQLSEWVASFTPTLHILVNNAGYGLSGYFEKYSIAENADMMQVNMRVPVELITRLLPMLKKEKQSYILNIASSAAYQSVPGLNLYAATKAFLLNFSRGLRKELEHTSVSVTCVCPGATDTNFVDRANINDKAKKTAQKLNMHPEVVARIALNSMFAGKAEVITGFVNKLGAFLVWLLPKRLSENIAANIYLISK